MQPEPAVPPVPAGPEPEGWWAIYTKHQHEKVAAEMLAAKGAEVFLPVYLAVRRWKDRRVKLSVPLFPCYLFVRAQIRFRIPVVSTPGIHMIVSNGGRLAVVSTAEIENLRRALQTPHGVQPHPYLRTGERVRVIQGPLEGLEGLLVRQKNLCRVVISVEMLARSAAVEVNAWDVALAPPRRMEAGMAPRCAAPEVPDCMPRLQPRLSRTNYEEIHEMS